jgi:UDP:flavonoid glycosyltransferase YjiC (YdhE family)
MRGCVSQSRPERRERNLQKAPSIPRPLDNGRTAAIRTHLVAEEPRGGTPRTMEPRNDQVTGPRRASNIAPGSHGSKHRILIVAEAVTLAHVGRPIALAGVLRRLGYEVTVACGPAGHRWLRSEGCPYEPIWSITSEQFMRSMSRGSPLFDASTLARYVEEDLAVIDRVRPDIVLGDFRLSLYVSTRLTRLPYGAIANAYWSPRCFEPAPVPEISLERWLGPAVANVLFRSTLPLAFRWHARPLASVCRHYGIEPPAANLLGTYTSSDCTAFADAEEFYSERSVQAPGATFVGPLQWSPVVPLPAGHERWGADRALIYVTMGSSGSPRVTERILAGLEDIDADVVVATAGARLSLTTRNSILVDYAPGEALCQRAALAVGNGGSPIAYQALRAGIPVLGLASNYDQFLNMHMVERIGAGHCLRASRATSRDIRDHMLALLKPGRARESASRARVILSSYDEPSRIRRWIHTLENRAGTAIGPATGSTITDSA